MDIPTTKRRLTAVLLITALLVSTVGATAVFAQAGDEPNDDQSDATSVDLGQQVEGELGTDDNDWYSAASVQRGQSVDVTFSVAGNASNGMYVALYDPNGSYVSGSATYADPGETVTASAIAESAGAYYVQVYPYAGATGSYSFEITSSDTDEFEPNQDQGSATTAALGTGVSAELTGNDNDWFTCGCLQSVQRGQTVNATLSVAGNASNGMYVALYDPNGSYVSGSATYADPGETVTASAIAESAGAYYVQVYPYAGATGQYTLQTSLGQGDQYEPNQDQGSAAAIQRDTQVSAALDDNDNDWFTFPGVRAGQNVEATFSVGADASNGMYIALYDSNGSYVSGSSEYVEPGQTGSTGVIAPNSGDYYVQVYPYAGSTGSYSFEATSSDTDDFEPNQDRESAASLSLGGSVSGELTDNDNEWFAVGDVAANGTLNATLSVEANASNGMYVALYDSDGDFISGSSEYVEPGQTGTATAPVERAGTYHVQVYPYAGSTGRYTLNTTTGGPVTPPEPTASVSFADQVSDGDSVVVGSTTLSEGGFVSIRNESGAVIGVSDYLTAGTHGNVEVELDRPLTEAATLTAVPHLDVDADRVFDFPADSTYLLDGQPVTDDAVVSLAESEPTANITFDDQVSGGTNVTVGSVNLSQGGFVAVQNAAGEVLGVSPYLGPGEHGNVRVDLDRPLESSQPLTAVAHLDTDGNGAFDYVTSGGDDDGPYVVAGQNVSDSAEITLELPPEQPTFNASVTFEDQASDGTNVTVRSANLSEGGFVVIHNASGAVIGHSGYLGAGEHENVSVALDQPITETATLTAMAHRDTDGDQAYDFPEADGPYFEDGQPVTDDALITVEGVEPTMPLVFDDQTSDGRNVTVSSVNMTTGGFVVVISGDGEDRILGVSDYLEPGQHEDVEVALDEPITENRTLIAVAQADTNGNQQYDSDRILDICRLEIDDTPLMDDAAINVSD